MAALGGLLASACVFDQITLPAGAPRVVVHGVLNPGLTDQVVLVERALDGRALAVRVPYDSLDPVVSEGGVPIRDARVVILGAAGDSVVLREDRSLRNDGRGAGVYRFRNLEGGGDPFDPVPWLAVRPGERYRLRVRTPEGEVVTGATTVPATPGRIVPAIPRQFHRDRDSMFLGWPDVAGTTRYEVRIETPSGPFSAFVDSLEYLVSGGLVHPRATGRPRVFWPGFRQVLTVSAVDANYHDYYRTGGDPLSARGLLVHLEGGLGLFGSVARVRERVVDVIGGPDALPAGRWEAVAGAGGDVPVRFELWRETAAFGATRHTGTVLGLPLGADPRAVVATQRGTGFTLAILARQSLRDTIVTIDARLESAGGEPRITGTVRGRGTAVTWRPQR